MAKKKVGKKPLKKKAAKKFLSKGKGKRKAAKRKSKEKTTVVFRKWPLSGDIVALFPEIPGFWPAYEEYPGASRHPSEIHKDYCLSYEQGKYDSQDYYEILHETKPADLKEYRVLKKEFEGMGCKLNVIDRARKSHHEARYKAAKEYQEVQKTGKMANNIGVAGYLGLAVASGAAGGTAYAVTSDYLRRKGERKELGMKTNPSSYPTHYPHETPHYTAMWSGKHDTPRIKHFDTLKQARKFAEKKSVEVGQDISIASPVGIIVEIVTEDDGQEFRGNPRNPQEKYVLLRDNRILFEGTVNECYAQLLRVQPSSVHHATKHEGYKVIRAKEVSPSHYKVPKAMSEEGFVYNPDKMIYGRDPIEKHFHAWIIPIPEERSEGKWDWRVKVERLADGKTKSTKVSGGQSIAEMHAVRLMKEVGVPIERLSGKRHGNPYRKTHTNSNVKTLLESACSLWGFMSHDMSLSRDERTAAKHAYRHAKLALSEGTTEKIKSVLESAQSLWGFMSHDMSLSEGERRAAKYSHKHVGQVLRGIGNPYRERRTNPKVPKLDKIITHRNIDKYLDALQREPEFRIDITGYRPTGKEWYRTSVILEFPTGELAEHGLKSLALVGRAVYVSTELTGKERFQAQGLEGKVQVRKDLFTALMNMRDLLPEYRGRIVVGGKLAKGMPGELPPLGMTRNPVDEDYFEIDEDDWEEE